MIKYFYPKLPLERLPSISPFFGYISTTWPFPETLKGLETFPNIVHDLFEIFKRALDCRRVPVRSGRSPMIFHISLNGNAIKDFVP